MKTAHHSAESLSRPQSAADIFLECLESRIAPAALVPGGKAVTYTDTDGDQVTVSFNQALPAGVNASDVLKFDSAFANNGNQSLQTIDLTALNAALTVEQFSKLTVTIKTKAAGGGNGTTDIGQLISDRDIMGFKTNGDIARINVGDNVLTTTGIKNFEAGSLGVGGVTAFGGTLVVDNLNSVIKGPVATFKVNGNVANVNLTFTGSDPAAVAVDKIEIKGALVANAVNIVPGHIGVTGGVGTFSIGQGITGNFIAQSGTVFITGGVGSFTVGGSLTGSGGVFSGRIQVGGDVGVFTLKGDIVGGVGADSGSVIISGETKAVGISGEVQGGMGERSGRVDIDGYTGSIKVGALIGGDGVESGTLSSGGAKTVAVTSATGGIQGGGGSLSGLLTLDFPASSISILGGILGGTGSSSGGVRVISGDFDGDGEMDVISKFSFAGGVTGGGAGTGFVDLGAFVKTFVGDFVQGGANSFSGIIGLNGGAGTFKLTGLITGGAGTNSGNVFTSNVTGSFAAAGLVGGSGVSSGGVYVAAGDINGDGENDILTKVSLPGIEGGSGMNSGSFISDAPVKTFLGGGVVGVGERSGRVELNGGVFTAKFGNVTGGAMLSGVLDFSAAESLTVGNITGGSGDFSGSVHIAAGDLDGDGTVDIITVGNLTGGSGTTTESGRIHVQANVGALKAGEIQGGGGTDSGNVLIEGNVKSAATVALTGGGGERSGSFTAQGHLGSFSTSMERDINGGAGSKSGVVTADSAGKISTGGIRGGGGAESGGLRIDGDVGSINIKYSIIGASGVQSAGIVADDIGVFSVGQNIIGSVGPNSATLVADNIATYKVGKGGIQGGSGGGSGGVLLNGTLGSATIGGNVTGNGSTPLEFIVMGGATEDTAIIDKFSIGGSALKFNLIAGFNPNNSTTGNNEGFVNSVSVKGDFSDSSISLGVENNGGGYGSPMNDRNFPATPTSVIRSVLIGGSVTSPTATTYAGIVAAHVLKVTINGSGVPLTDGAGNDALAVVPNFFVREIN